MPAAASRLAAEGRLPEWWARLLARRGVDDPASTRAFLDPCESDLFDPFELAGMTPAVERLLVARERGEVVVIVGDYDVDGITGTALLLAVLRHCGLKVEAILPHRLRDGYGFQLVHVERAQELGARTIVTVDCGTTAIAAAEAARSAGLDVIVTDHHRPGPPLPAGVIHINPLQDGCRYPFPFLSGVGLALKLAQAMVLRSTARPAELAPLLRVACLGTIADLVPLVGENRVIAALGLRELPRTRSVGLQALMRQAGVHSPLTAADVGFRLGPRINAVGRLDDPIQALDLLLSKDRVRAEALAAEIERWNRERQDEEARVVAEARAEIVGRGEPLAPFLLAWSERWHRGVVGIAAGRLAREFHRPTILLAVAGAEATGSGRSISGLDLHAFVDPFRERLVRFGGHAQAIGLTARTDELDALRVSWEEAAAEQFPCELLERTYEYELELDPGAVRSTLPAELARLEPHGPGNPRPLARVGPLALSGPARHFGKGHLSAVAQGAGGAEVHLLGWGWGEREHELQGRFEVLGHIEEDRYRGGPVVRLVDSRPAGEEIQT